MSRREVGDGSETYGLCLVTRAFATEGALRTTRSVILSLAFEVCIHLCIPEEQHSIEGCHVGIFVRVFIESSRFRVVGKAPSAAKSPINPRADAPVAEEVDRRASLGWILIMGTVPRSNRTDTRRYFCDLSCLYHTVCSGSLCPPRPEDWRRGRSQGDPCKD